MRAKRISSWVAGLILFAASFAQAGPVVVFPRPIPAPDYGDFTLTASAGPIALGQPVTGTWTASPPRSGDWVGLYPAGGTEGQYYTYCYTNALATGSCSLTPPSAGTWELRYYLGTPAYTMVAISERFEVFDPCAGLTHSLVAVGPLTGGALRRIDVRWNLNPSTCGGGSDWIGLYAVGSPDTAYLGYFYPGTGSGTQSVMAPVGTGSYEFRYLPRGGYTSVVRSNPFMVTCAANDADCDSRLDASDRCPYYAESDPLADTDADGRGNECECSDQSGDGRNTVADVVAINQAIFDPARATPLCDGNNDGLCDVQDVVAASNEIRSTGHTATCNRFPFLP
jgi:hypothetical protein